MVASSERVNGPATWLTQKSSGGREPSIMLVDRAQGPLETAALGTWMAQDKPTPRATLRPSPGKLPKSF